jgi:hypothetical protein
MRMTSGQKITGSVLERKGLRFTGQSGFARLRGRVAATGALG